MWKYRDAIISCDSVMKSLCIMVNIKNANEKYHQQQLPQLQSSSSSVVQVNGMYAKLTAESLYGIHSIFAVIVSDEMVITRQRYHQNQHTKSVICVKVFVFRDHHKKYTMHWIMVSRLVCVV